MKAESMPAIKKLIEVAIPLAKINAEASREKSIRHGHPSTLHLWWARRPLAAARAVIFASLVDDPASHPELFPTSEAQQKERKRLFDLIAELVVWEHSNNKEILDAAKSEIRKWNKVLPEFLDPFSGGGALPLEAQRLGLVAHAQDLNPVAVMIEKAMIEIPPRFADLPPVNPKSRQERSSAKHMWHGAEGLAADVRFYGDLIRRAAHREIGHLYPEIDLPPEYGKDQKAKVIAWIWVRTVKCQNPACGCVIPLASSFILSKKSGHEAWVEPHIAGVNHDLSFAVHKGPCPKGKETAKVGRGGMFVCPVCGGSTTDEYVKDCGKAGKIDARLMAIVAEGPRGRVYLSPKEADEVIAKCEKPSAYPTGAMPKNPRWFSPPAFGLPNYEDLFTNRQLTALTTFSDLVGEVRKYIERDALAAGLSDDHVPLAEDGKGAQAYAEAVAVYLGFAIDKGANLWSTLCGWMSDRGALRETFARQAIPMVWDFAEANPFSECGGNISMFVERISDTLLALPSYMGCSAKQADAQSDNGMRDILVSTDPPYYDNIGYADLSDFFYIWMRRSLKPIYPKLFATMLTPKVEELIATPYRHENSKEKAQEFFEDGMLATFRRIHEYTRDDLPVTVYYAYKQSETKSEDDTTVSTGWETMLAAIVKAGFQLTGTWPMETEGAGRAISQGTNALSSSIVLVCRKRAADAPEGTRREFQMALRRELGPAIRNLMAANLAATDLAQAAIGPGMAVYSRYAAVCDAAGHPVTVRAALAMINQELDLILSAQGDDLDRESRFCVDFYENHAFNEGVFGDAQVLATAKSVSIDGMRAAGFLNAKGGKVSLRVREDLPAPDDAEKQPVWLLAQRMTGAMEKGGTKGVAEVLAPLKGVIVEQAKALTYRLYQIADRKGWTEEALAYNALISMWTDVQDVAADIRKNAPQRTVQDDLPVKEEK